MFTDDEKRALILSSVQTIESIDNFLSIGEAFGFDWIQVSLHLYEKDQDGNLISENVEFQVPSGDISLFETMREHPLDDIITIYDREDNELGYLRTELNSSIVFIVTFPIILILCFIALVTFIIVRILLGPSTYKLVKPVNALNKQLKCISENEVLDSTIHIEMKKPPKEIYELIKYSNIIMGRLNESQELLFAQNQELEAQRDVLEAQRDELEAQNEELDSQNDELMQSQLELKKAQDRLVQSEKLASMGQLTAAIAHEINTPLGAVSSNSQMVDMILMKLTKLINENDIEGVHKIVEKLRNNNKITIDAANRVNEIIRNLRNFSRIDQAEFQNADVNEGIQSVLVLTSNLWKNKVTINESYGSIPEINCYPSMLNQVFMNVIVNAIQATEKNGEIDIITEKVDQNIVIKIKDNGEGIQETLLDKIFESGFTTKPKDAGTGLGLSISKDIIKKHHGSIRAYNNEEKGATFEISLPIKQIEHDETCDHE
jgi:signal transduction histidine kinase